MNQLQKLTDKIRYSLRNTEKCLILFSIFFITLSLGCTQNFTANSPKIVRGILDITEYDLDSNQSLVLIGDWKFQWMNWKFGREPEASQQNSDRDDLETIFVPSSWNEPGGERLGDGYATYEVTVYLGKKYQELALGLPDQSSSYQVYIDGRKVAECGKVYFENSSDQTQFRVTPAWCNQFVRFVPEKQDFKIDVQIANMDHRLGGFWAPIRLGESKRLESFWEKDRYLDVFLTGGLFCIGFLHLAFAFARRRESSSLYFGLFCFLMTIRGIFAGNRIGADFFPFIEYAYLVRIEYISFYLVVPVFLNYILSVYPRELKRILVDLVWWIAIAATVVVFIFPVRIFTYTVTVYYLVAFLAGTLGLFALTRAAIRKREGALIILGGFVFVYGSMIHDLFYVTFFLDTGYLTNIGSFAFILAQSVFLSFRNSTNLDRVLDLSRNLERKVEDRTKQLKNALRLIRNDLTVAREIQKGLLNLEDNATIIASGLRFNVVHKPLSEVGGDLYDIAEFPDGRIRIFIADATGHGVQAALITILIRSVYEDLRESATLSPGELMSELGSEFYRKYGNIGTYFSASVLEIDRKDRNLKYALAGSPPILIQGTEGEVVLECENPLVGLLEDFNYPDSEITLSSQFRILCFTDGLTDLAREAGDTFGAERVLSLLHSGRNTELGELTKKIYDELFRFLGTAGQKDDVLLLGIEVAEDT
ncbi:protein phosphatase [Leptospira perolatii]|uniref:Protein phosphatase n=2 Tax=Leptospira perolatii TaxID=2023191 RepID=A0A2M9ZPY5_9LEPT|nr:protein phosphatase [Leptospira perolatii]PJZ74137.1 protein phosphatase [Leptospira perolatii]